MENVTLRKFPFPPSVNAIYKNNYGRGRRGRSKTDTANRYAHDCALWDKINFLETQMVRVKVQEWLGDKFVLELTLHFVYLYEDIFTKNGIPKKNDVSNRVKILEDRLSKILGFDDRFFFKIKIEKYVGIEKFVDIEIGPIKSKKYTPKENK